MKDIFPEFYPPTPDEFDELWENCIFVLDTNVLVDLYRYSVEAREDFISILGNERIRNRLWLPYHAAYEFQKRRIDAIVDKRQKFGSLKDSLVTLIDSIEESLKDVREKAKELNKLNRLRKGLIIDIDEVSTSLKSVVESVNEQLDAQRKDLQRYKTSDPIREKIDTLFQDKIGSPLNTEDAENIYKEGVKRFKDKTPPGYIDYKDKTKDEDEANPDFTNANNQFGDLIIWEQVLRKAEADKTSIIFVTGDQKEDWFRKVKGETIGPRFELTEEFKKRVGKTMYIYPTGSFYEKAKEFLKEEIQQEIFQEVKALRSREEQESHEYRALSLNLLNKLNEDLRSFVIPAFIRFIRGSGDTVEVLRFYFSQGKKFHQHQLITRKHELLDAAQEMFGPDVRIEIWQEVGNQEYALNMSFDKSSRIEQANTTSDVMLGRRVDDPTFGLGTIIGVHGSGPHKQVDVHFDRSDNMRRLLVSRLKHLYQDE